MASPDVKDFDYNAGVEEEDEANSFEAINGGVAADGVCSSFFASEVDTPYTCVYILLAVLFVEFFVDFYTYLAQYTDRERLSQIEDQLAILRLKEEKLHGIDNFTKRAKVQRAINALEKDLRPLKEKLDDSLMSAFTSSSTSSLTAFLFKKGWQFLSQPLLISFVALYYWGTPLVYFPSAWFYPFSYFLRFSDSGSDTSISAVVWAIICYRALRRITRGLFL